MSRRPLAAYGLVAMVTSVGEARMALVRERHHTRHDDESVSAIDGVRVDHGDGWTLVRASGTQPLSRVTTEARDPKRADELLAEAKSVVAESERAR